MSEQNEASWFARLKKGLNRTRHGLRDRFIEVIAGRNAIDDDLYDELEEVLILSFRAVFESGNFFVYPANLF